MRSSCGVYGVGGEDPREEQADAEDAEQNGAYTRAPRAPRRLSDAKAQGQSTEPEGKERDRLDVAEPADGELADVIPREAVLRDKATA
jgi:hypothetical protein